MVDVVNGGLALSFYTDTSAFAAMVVDPATEPMTLQQIETAVAAGGLEDLAKDVFAARRLREMAEGKGDTTVLKRSLQRFAKADEVRLRNALVKHFATSDEARAVAISALKTAAPVRNDEDRLAGPEWRREILPMALRELGFKGNTPLEIALDALRKRDAAVAVQTVALRVVGDNLRALDTVEKFLRTLEVVADILEQDNNPFLQQMALTLLYQINRPPIDVLIPDFSLKQFFDGALGKKGERVWMIDGKSAPAEDLQANADRIRTLKLRILSLLGQEQQRPVAGWDAVYPREWYEAIPKLFETPHEMRNPIFHHANRVFLNTEIDLWKIDLWARALALAYFASIPGEHHRFYSEGLEFEGALNDLLALLRRDKEEPLLKQMAVFVYERLVVNRMELLLDQLQFQSAFTLIYRKTEELEAVIGAEHPVVKSLRKRVGALERALASESHRIASPTWRSVRWWSRLPIGWLFPR